MQEGSHWVTSEVKGVPEDQVADWAALDADLLLFHELLEVRV